MNLCRICGNETGNRRFVAREMQLGLREEFEYVDCAQCGCMQIASIPDNLDRYYPRDYYAFQSLENGAQPSGSERGHLSQWKRALIVRFLTAHFFRRRSLFGSWLARRSSVVDDYPEWLREKKIDLGLDLNSPILDVGCGNGRLLLEFRANGLTNLTGVDPFVDADIDYGNGVRVLKKPLEAVDRKFRLVMLNHAFEHIPNPEACLQEVARVLEPVGFAVIRIPVAGSLAWKKYGVHWFALDAPRHLHLHTLQSMQLLAGRTGFEIADWLFDSWGISWWASEQYLRDIPFMDPRSYQIARSKSLMFTEEQVAKLIAYDKTLNKTGEADCACFILSKK